MFNISQIAYGLRSKKAQTSIPCLSFLIDNGYHVEFDLYHEESDNFFVVLSHTRKIIVAFKGTTGMENMKADMKMMQTRLCSVLPTHGVPNYAGMKLQEWKAAKVHRGFVEAYCTLNSELIRKIGLLLSTSPRPVYFTGHSLGGALATLCSLDVVLSLNHSDVYVSTFGSP